MMKVMKTIKRIVGFVLFCAIAATVILQINAVAHNKANNRYYYLEDYVESRNESYEVQVYGSCHAYTSFNARYFTEKHGISSFVLANPCEIVPISYLRMYERFKTDAPKVVLFDTWGLNPYETYISEKAIFEDYCPYNIERIPLSIEKLKVINDFDSFDILEDTFAIAKYKDRFLERTIDNFDFDFTYEEFCERTEESLAHEMELRRANRGFLAKEFTTDLSDYEERQAKVDKTDSMPYEDDIIKYLEKIIALCDEYDVQLILYRAPYIATENELRKVNWLVDYCEERDIPFYNLDEEVVYNYRYDFQDDWHLNVGGAEKATDYLSDIILEYFE